MKVYETFIMPDGVEVKIEIAKGTQRSLGNSSVEIPLHYWAEIKRQWFIRRQKANRRKHEQDKLMKRRYGSLLGSRGIMA